MAATAYLTSYGVPFGAALVGLCAWVIADTLSGDRQTMFELFGPIVGLNLVLGLAALPIWWLT